jgi:hypothetical protein
MLLEVDNAYTPTVAARLYQCRLRSLDGATKPRVPWTQFGLFHFVITGYCFVITSIARTRWLPIASTAISASKST